MITTKLLNYLILFCIPASILETGLHGWWGIFSDDWVHIGQVSDPSQSDADKPPQAHLQSIYNHQTVKYSCSWTSGWYLRKICASTKRTYNLHTERSHTRFWPVFCKYLRNKLKLSGETSCFQPNSAGNKDGGKILNKNSLLTTFYKVL